MTPRTPPLNGERTSTSLHCRKPAALWFGPNLQLRHPANSRRHQAPASSKKCASQHFAIAPELEIRTAPGVKFARAPPRPAGARLRATLADVAHQLYRDVMSARRLAQIGEQRRGLRPSVLVHPVKMDEEVVATRRPFQRGPSCRARCPAAPTVVGRMRSPSMLFPRCSFTFSSPSPRTP